MYQEMNEEDLFNYQSTENIEVKALSKHDLNRGYFAINQIQPEKLIHKQNFKNDELDF